MCASLSTQQLLRPDGIYGLYGALFEEDSSPSLVKLEHAAKLVSSVPSGTNPRVCLPIHAIYGLNSYTQEYFTTVVPRLLQIASGAGPVAYKNAAAFAIAQMLSPSLNTLHPDLASSIIVSFLHGSFGPASDISQHLSPRQALETLISIIAHAGPSPTLVSKLLSPVVTHLYSLLFHLDSIKTSDPSLRTGIRDILSAWARLAPLLETVDTLWHIIMGERVYWKVGLDGELNITTV